MKTNNNQHRSVVKGSNECYFTYEAKFTLASVNYPQRHIDNMTVMQTSHQTAKTLMLQQPTLKACFYETGTRTLYDCPHI